MDNVEMVYVQRETDPEQPDFGKVKGVFRQKQEGYAEEELPADHEHVQDFQKRLVDIRAQNKKGAA